jgi:hypothetical protein
MSFNYNYQTLYEMTNRLLYNITQPNVNPVFLNHITSDIEQWNNSLEHNHYNPNADLETIRNQNRGVQPGHYRQNYVQNVPAFSNTPSFPQRPVTTSYSNVYNYASLPTVGAVTTNPEDVSQNYYKNNGNNGSQSSSGPPLHPLQPLQRPQNSQNSQRPQRMQRTPPRQARNETSPPSLSNDSISSLVSTMFDQFMNHSNMDNFIMEEFEDANGTRVTIQQYGIGVNSNGGSFALPDIIRSGNEINIQNLLSQLVQTVLNDDDINIGEDQPVPLPIDVLTQIPIKKYTDQVNLADPCAVCQNQYKKDDSYRTLFCNHNFHTHCIDKWFEDHVTCPMCRSDMRDLLVAEVDEGSDEIQ